MIVRAEKLALEKTILAGEHIPHSEVQARWHATVVQVRSAMLALPRRRTRRLPSRVT